MSVSVRARRKRWAVIYGMLILLLVGCRGWLAAPPPVVTANAFFAQAVLDAGALRIGEQQQLHLLLEKTVTSETIFQLTVTYANGIEQRVIKATLGRETTLSWEIPADAGVGVATFHLATSDCGCGDRSPGQVTLTGEAEGEFHVR